MIDRWGQNIQYSYILLWPRWLFEATKRRLPPLRNNYQRGDPKYMRVGAADVRKSRFWETEQFCPKNLEIYYCSFERTRLSGGEFTGIHSRHRKFYRLPESTLCNIS